MKELTKERVQSAAEHFQFVGRFSEALSYGSGHINDTFAARFERPDGKSRPYVLQRINTEVFQKPLELMENIVHVTDHIRNTVTQMGGDPFRETLTIVPAIDDRSVYCDREGEYWRAYLFIDGTVSYDTAESEEDLYQSARAFGRFQQMLADFPAETLHETIPDFHNTPDRVSKFKEALDRDLLGRAESVQKEIDFVFRHEEETHRLVDLQKAGRLPLRVTHNDTKLNNVLIDRKTGEGICIVDLDTVMPGLSLYDYGDSIRFGATYAAEDEPNLSRVNFDPGLFEAYTKGYLEIAGEVLTDCETENLPMGAKLMTLECGIRFLTDYLSGDTYFKTDREGQNLDRCRTQFKLVSDMEKEWKTMSDIVKKYSNGPDGKKS